MRKLYFTTVFFLSFSVIPGMAGEMLLSSPDTSLQFVIDGIISARPYIPGQYRNSDDQYNGPWARVDFELTDGKWVRGATGRYNGFLDEVMWLRKTDYKIGVVEKYMLHGFNYYNPDNNSVSRYRIIKSKNWYNVDSSYMCYQVLVDGNVSLYCQRKININTTTNEFYPNYSYFILKNGLLIYFKPSRRNLYKMFKEDKENLRQIIKANHLKIRKEQGLMQALELYNRSKNATNQ